MKQGLRVFHSQVLEVCERQLADRFLAAALVGRMGLSEGGKAVSVIKSWQACFEAVVHLPFPWPRLPKGARSSGDTCQQHPVRL